jgi:hypothetical protein
MDGAADLIGQKLLDVLEVHARLAGKVAPAIAVVEERKQTLGVAAADLRYLSPAGQFEALIPLLRLASSALPNVRDRCSVFADP